MAEVLKTVLLLALPASGKSEVRRYLKLLSPHECRHDFHLGETVQLDDFPYVHLMRRIDDELAATGQPRIYFQSPDRPYQDPMDWGTLIQLVNEDYDDVLHRRRSVAHSASLWLFERFDRAAEKAGASSRLRQLSDQSRHAVAKALETEAQDLLREKNAGIPDSLTGKTVVIEFARGGAQGSTYPLARGFGYRHSLAQLSDAILTHASVLYIWVTPEESRRKNHERTDPNDPGSILNHGVPIEVMLKDYGCDDMDWLEANAKIPGTVTVSAHTKTYDLPVARFDNRTDKTTFIREPKEKWPTDKVAAVHSGLQGALQNLAKARR